MSETTISSVERLHALTNDEELASALGALPALPCSPQASLLLACVSNHLSRQEWVAGVVCNAIGVPIDALIAGAFSRPDDIPTDGPVPGHDGWTYYFHGQGCCLTHQDGTSLDVDFPQGRVDSIDPYFYACYLETVPSLPPLESELRGRYPEENAWMFDVEELRSLGWAEGNHAFSITPAGQVVAGKFARHSKAVNSKRSAFERAYSAAVLGQFSLALFLLDDVEAPKSFGILKAADATAKEQRTATLLKLARKRKETELRQVLRAMVAVGEGPERLALGLLLKRRRLDSATFYAVDLMARAGASKYVDELLRLVKTARSGKPPAPGLRVSAIQQLFEYFEPHTIPSKTRTSLLKALRRPSDRMTDRVGQLQYLLEPPLGLATLKVALSSKTPITCQSAAAALATIGTDDAMGILREHDSSHASAMCAIHDGKNLAEVIPIGREIDMEGKKVRVYSSDEIEAANLTSYLQELYGKQQRDYRPLLERWGHP